jgi:polyphenol oxidase
MRTGWFRDPEGWQLPLLRASVLPQGFAHGFTTRDGGVSGAPYASLNLGMKWGDAPDNVIENRRRVGRAAGARPVFAARQVHGAVVIPVRAGDTPADLARLEADGLCAADPGVVLAVYVADCIPALIADPRTGAFAAVHAGWRGTVAGVLPAAVRALEQHFGARPADLRVALGPAIGACCFEVGGEVAAAFEHVIPEARASSVVLEAGPGRAGKARVDLKAANRILLERAGVPPAAVETGPECTSCGGERFYSFRRDGSQTGQHLGFIAREPA